MHMQGFAFGLFIVMVMYSFTSYAMDMVHDFNPKDNTKYMNPSTVCEMMLLSMDDSLPVKSNKGICFIPDSLKKSSSPLAIQYFTGENFLQMCSNVVIPVAVGLLSEVLSKGSSNINKDCSNFEVQFKEKIHSIEEIISRENELLLSKNPKKTSNDQLENINKSKMFVNLCRNLRNQLSSFAIDLKDIQTSLFQNLLLDLQYEINAVSLKMCLLIVNQMVEIERKVGHDPYSLDCLDPEFLEFVNLDSLSTGNPKALTSSRSSKPISKPISMTPRESKSNSESGSPKLKVNSPLPGLKMLRSSSKSSSQSSVSITDELPTKKVTFTPDTKQ